METMLQAIYEELKYLKLVKNQTDFGEQLGFKKAYTSTLLKQADVPLHIYKKLLEVYNVDPDWIKHYGDAGYEKVRFKQNAAQRTEPTKNTRNTVSAAPDSTRILVSPSDKTWDNYMNQLFDFLKTEQTQRGELQTIMLKTVDSNNELVRTNSLLATHLVSPGGSLGKAVAS